MPAGLEIERKYLLSSAPSVAELADLGAQPRQIEQVYLRSADGWVRRVRKVEAAGRTRYVATRKREIGGIVREEHEEELDAAAYGRHVADADPVRMGTGACGARTLQAWTAQAWTAAPRWCSWSCSGRACSSPAWS